MLEMANDPEMVEVDIGRHSAHQGDERGLRARHHPRGWDEGTNRIWAIEAEGRFAGNVDIRQGPIGDIGFALHPWARGKGLMARAVRLAVDWAFNEGGIEIVHWRSHVGNEASLRIAHATGFTMHGTTPGILLERGEVLDAWTASIRFGDAPFPRTPWAESTVLESDRLRLRPNIDADLPRIAEACSDADDAALAQQPPAARIPQRRRGPTSTTASGRPPRAPRRRGRSPTAAPISCSATSP